MTARRTTLTALGRIVLTGMLLAHPWTAADGVAQDDADSSDSNVRIEVTITEKRGDETKSKTVRMTVVGEGSGRIRSTYETKGRGPDNPVKRYPLMIDASPFPRADGRIRLLLRLNLAVPQPGTGDGGVPDHVEVSEEMEVIVENGEPLVVAESADPLTDLSIIVEARATVLD